MSIVSCPRCRDEVTVPAKAPADAIVRCPLCREEYRLDEALDQLPPKLIVVGGGSDDDEGGELVGAGVGRGYGNEYQVAGSQPSFGGLGSGTAYATTGPGTAVADAGLAPPPRLQAAPRQKKKEKSAVLEILKVMLGGLAAIPAAQLVLWWAFGQDPVDLGPKVAAIPYLAWAVPASLRSGNGVPAPGNTGLGGAGGQNAPIVAANSGKAKLPENTFKTPTELENRNDFLPSKNDSERPPPADPLGTADEMPADPLTETPAFPPLVPGLGDPAPSDPTIGLDPPPADATGAEVGGKTAINGDPNETEPPPAVAPAFLEGAAADVLAARDAFDAATANKETRAVQKQLAIEMYSAAAKLGPLLIDLPNDNPDLAPALAKVDESIVAVADPSKRTILTFLAGQRFDAPDAGEGMLLVGAVKGFQAMGPWFEATLEIPGKTTRSATIVSKTNLQDRFKENDTIVVVGNLVRDAAAELPGYSGTGTTIVREGRSISAP